MIRIEINELTAAEEMAVLDAMRSATPTSIYDDVAHLQMQMEEVRQSLAGLDERFISSKSTNLNDADLNNCIGKFIMGYGNNCINRPGNQNGYLINIPHNSAPTKFGVQIWLARPTLAVYVRFLENGTFKEWVKLH
jgi:hypothetical protein